MENKVYYGEFSLKYWMELMLKSEVVMPDYQRNFVWTEEQVRKLVESLKNKEFIPPVTIGSCIKDGKRYNYIIDGQQRLTAILLAKVEYFPNIQKWEKIVDNHLEDAVEYEDNKDDENEITYDSIKWSFPKLLEDIVKRDIETIKQKCAESGNYKRFSFELDDEFYSKTFLGFSYIVPKDVDEAEQHKYYSTIFRNINFQGTELQAEESREALYFWNTQRTYWFKPDFAGKIKGHTIKGDTYLDFVRYASILSQYQKVERRLASVCKGTRFSFEEYYEQYIYSTAQDYDDAIFGKFSNLFHTDDNAKIILTNVAQSIANLGLETERYDTIIKMDIYFFGLLFFIIFKNEKIDVSRKEELKKELENKWNAYDERHKRAPKAKKYLRQRISDSIDIYERYLINQ